MLIQGTPPASKRQFPSWIDSFVEQTDFVGTARILRKWVAYSCVATALQRKCYIIVRGQRLHPNMYIFLVAEPGVGKTLSIVQGRKVVSRVPKLKLSPTSITKEAFADFMSSAVQQHTLGTDILMHSSVTAMIDEMSVFLRTRDFPFMSDLTDIYDCPPSWEHRTRHFGNIEVQQPYLNIIGGITPRTLAETFGQQAFGLGFTSRLLLVYSDEKTKNDLFDLPSEPDLSPLSTDLEIITHIAGEFKFSKEAVEKIRAWTSSGLQPVPQDLRFDEYNNRRAVHLVKLAVLRSASRTSDMIVSLDDLEIAMRDMFEMEAVMDGAVKHVGENPISAAVIRLNQWVKITYSLNSKKPVEEARLRRKLMDEVPPQYHDSVLDNMLAAGMIAMASGSAAKPLRSFIPGKS